MRLSASPPRPHRQRPPRPRLRPLWTGIAALLLALLALAGCGGDGASGNGGGGDGGDQQGSAAAPVETTTVVTEGNRFEPEAIRVTPGATVTWRIEGGIPHDVTGDGWGSGQPRSDTTFTHTFEQPGTYDYRCTIHPGMDGQVTVEPR